MIIRPFDRFATFEATVECLCSMGLGSQASPLLEALSFRNPPQKVNLRDLVGALQASLFFSPPGLSIKLSLCYVDYRKK